MTRLSLLPRVLLASLLPALLAACGDDQDPEGASELWDRIHEQDYSSWMRAPGYEQRRDTEAPHSEQVDIFVNDTVAAALVGPAITAWPEGSLIVKDGYDGSELEIVAAMEKRDGKWFWAEWDADGESVYSGDPATCTDCHQSGADMVRAFGFPR